MGGAVTRDQVMQLATTAFPVEQKATTRVGGISDAADLDLTQMNASLFRWLSPSRVFRFLRSK